MPQWLRPPRKALGSAARGRRSGAHLLKEDADAKPMGDRVRMRMTDVLATQMPIVPTEAFGHRIQQSLQVILAGLAEQGELSASDTEDLQARLCGKIASARAGRDRRGRNGQGRVGLGIHDAAENRRLSQPCGSASRSEPTQEIWTQFGAEVALASRGHYDHWALDVEHPRLLLALVILLDQFSPATCTATRRRCTPATRTASRW